MSRYMAVRKKRCEGNVNNCSAGIQDRRLKFLVKILLCKEHPLYDLFGLFVGTCDKKMYIHI